MDSSVASSSNSDTAICLSPRICRAALSRVSAGGLREARRGERDDDAGLVGRANARVASVIVLSGVVSSRSPLAFTAVHNLKQAMQTLLYDKLVLSMREATGNARIHLDDTNSMTIGVVGRDQLSRRLIQTSCPTSNVVNNKHVSTNCN